jgi:hypothetical protein
VRRNFEPLSEVLPELTPITRMQLQPYHLDEGSVRLKPLPDYLARTTPTPYLLSRRPS